MRFSNIFILAKYHTTTSPNYFHQNCEILDLKTNMVLHDELPSFQQQFCLWDKHNSDLFSRLVHCAHALFHQEEACLDGIPQSQNLCRCSFPFGFILFLVRNDVEYYCCRLDSLEASTEMELGEQDTY